MIGKTFEEERQKNSERAAGSCIARFILDGEIVKNIDLFRGP